MQVSIDSLLNTTGSSLSSSGTASSGKANDELDKMDFLELLCTQLRYQDPLNPQSDTDMASQLAQYSSLDYMKEIKTSIDNQTENFSSVVSTLQYSALSSTNSATVSFIGKNVRTKQSTVDFDGVTAESFKVHLGNNSSATVSLCDVDGNCIKTFIANGKDSDNSVTLNWDGTADDGTSAEQGKYTIKIDGEDVDEQLYCYIDGTVSGVRFSSSGPMIKIDGNEVSVGSVIEIF